jgi:hypothetical protein
MLLLPPDKIIIHLDSYVFVPGDTIRGNLEIVCSEPVKGDRLSIGLNGIYRQNNFSTSSSEGMPSESNSPYYFSQRITLLGSEEYMNQVVPFAYVIPSNILPKWPGILEYLVKLPPWSTMILTITLILKQLEQSQNIPEFILEARIDIPRGIDITGKIPVSIEQKPAKILNLPISSPEVTNELNK